MNNKLFLLAIAVAVVIVMEPKLVITVNPPVKK